MIALLAAAVAADAVLLVAASLWTPTAPLFGPLHVGATLVALAAVRRGGVWQAPGGWTTWIGAAGGPAGIALAIALLPLVARRRRRLMLPAAEEEIGDPPPPPSIHAEALPDPAQLGAFAAVFRHGSIAERQTAIESVVSVYEPRLSGVVALGLVDGDQTIRALAASASTRAGQLLAQRRRRLERVAAASDAVEDRLALAELLADFGLHDRLLSDTARARLRDEAATELDGVVAMLPAGDPRRVTAEALRYRLRPGGDAQALPLSLALDALLRARDRAGLAKRCAAPDACALSSDDPLHAVVAFWRGASAA